MGGLLIDRCGGLLAAIGRGFPLSEISPLRLERTSPRLSASGAWAKLLSGFARGRWTNHEPWVRLCRRPLIR